MAIPAYHPEPEPVSDDEATVAGSITRSWVWGDPDATTTIVAVHGFRGDHHGLLPIVARLNGYRIVTPDLPGFGASSRFDRGAHDIAGYAAWLTEFCVQMFHLV